MAMGGVRRGGSWSAALTTLAVCAACAACARAQRGGGAAGGCPEEYLACVRAADPLLTDARLVFPDNMADVNELCARWRDFERCVEAFAARCFSPARQEAFARAVESPLGLAHRLCSELRYQKEYLEYAFCIHSTIKENGRCSRLYQELVDRALGEAEEKPLCCAQRRFEECASAEAARVCGGGGGVGGDGDGGGAGDAEGPETAGAAKGAARAAGAGAFARRLLSRAFSYVHTRCEAASAFSEDCGAQGDEYGRAQNETVVVVGGGGSGFGTGTGSSGGEQQPRTNPASPLPHSPGGEPMRPAWQPGRALDGGAQGLGRGSDGDDEGEREDTSVPRDPPRTWFPWGKAGNAVDEPNQQGLSGSGAALLQAPLPALWTVPLLARAFR